MTYRGTIQGGVVVFADRRRPREGTPVEVRAVATRATDKKPRAPKARPRRGTPQAVLRHRGTWEGEPGEMARLLAELKRIKQAEVEMERRHVSHAAQTFTPAAGAGPKPPPKRRTA